MVGGAPGSLSEARKPRPTTGLRPIRSVKFEVTLPPRTPLGLSRARQVETEIGGRISGCEAVEKARLAPPVEEIAAGDCGLLVVASPVRPPDDDDAVGAPGSAGAAAAPRG